jgi:hypothetical protein
VSRCLKRVAAPARGVADLVLIMMYGAVFLACMVETIAHTPSCFKVVM